MEGMYWVTEKDGWLSVIYFQCGLEPAPEGSWGDKEWWALLQQRWKNERMRSLRWSDSGNNSRNVFSASVALLPSHTWGWSELCAGAGGVVKKRSVCTPKSSKLQLPCYSHQLWFAAMCWSWYAPKNTLVRKRPRSLRHSLLQSAGLWADHAHPVIRIQAK